MPKTRPLTGLDAAFLYLEGLGTPMHVGSLMLLRMPDGFDGDFHARLCEHLEGRLGAAAPLRRVLESAPLSIGHPLWREQAPLDMDWHIQRRTLRKPGSHNALMKLVGRLHAEPLDRSRPMWQLVVIDGLADGQVAVYSKLHHAMIDGQGGIALARALLDVEPKPRHPQSPAIPAPGSGPTGRARLAVRAGAATAGTLGRWIRGVPGTLKMAAAGTMSPRKTFSGIRDSVMLAPRSLFNVQISDRRAFAVASLELDRCKRVAHGLGASLNDVVMALCTSALRETLIRRGALPKRAMVAGMPVSLRAQGDGEANNQVSMVQCELPTDQADADARLARIHAATDKIKARVRAFTSLIPTDFPGLAAPLWATGLSRLWERGRLSERLPPLANLVISNVPGPPMPLYLAGAAVTHYYPMSIVTHGLALNITVQSYAGRLEFGVLSCPDALPRPRSLTNRLAGALEELERGLSE